MAAPALTQYVQGLGQVSADGLNSMEQTCDTFAQLRTLVGLPGMQVFARGGAAIGDGLQGVFYWSASNPGPDNGSTVIVPTGALLGAWVKLALVTNSAFPLGQCRLIFNSSTQIQLNPYNGNNIQIAGGLYQIPSSGITAGTTGVFVNGAANQNLVLNTLYYVYVFSNSGTPTIDFSTTSYAQDTTTGNVGVYIKNSTPSRSLVGMVYINSGTIFSDSVGARNTASWFNRSLKAANSTAITNATTTSLSLLELGNGTTNRLEMTSWADDHPYLSIQAFGSNGTGGDGAAANVGDGSTLPLFQAVAALSGANNEVVNLSQAGSYPASEGHHSYLPLGQAESGGTAAINMALYGLVRN